MPQVTQRHWLLLAVDMDIFYGFFFSIPLGMLQTGCCSHSAPWEVKGLRDPEILLAPGSLSFVLSGTVVKAQTEVAAVWAGGDRSQGCPVQGRAWGGAAPQPLGREEPWGLGSLLLEAPGLCCWQPL